jgi:hypothetical protein
VGRHLAEGGVTTGFQEGEDALASGIHGVILRVFKHQR